LFLFSLQFALRTTPFLPNDISSQRRRRNIVNNCPDILLLLSRIMDYCYRRYSSSSRLRLSLAVVAIVLFSAQDDFLSVKASPSSFNLGGRGRYSEAAFRASEDLARQEQRATNDRNNKKRRSRNINKSTTEECPQRKKKTMEEAIQSAKKFSKLDITDDEMEEEDSTFPVPPLSSLDSDYSSDDDSEPFVLPTSGIIWDDNDS
jgi:hypothetical protein